MEGLPSLELAAQGGTQTVEGAPVSLSLGGDFIIHGNKRVWSLTEKILFGAAIAGGFWWMYRH